MSKAGEGKREDKDDETRVVGVTKWAGRAGLRTGFGKHSQQNIPGIRYPIPMRRIDIMQGCITNVSLLIVNSVCQE